MYKEEEEGGHGAPLGWEIPECRLEDQVVELHEETGEVPW